MKKVRFFSVAVAVVMALFVSVWAATGSGKFNSGTAMSIAGLSVGSSKNSNEISYKIPSPPSNATITSVVFNPGTVTTNQGSLQANSVTIRYGSGSNSTTINWNGSSEVTTNAFNGLPANAIIYVLYNAKCIAGYMVAGQMVNMCSKSNTNTSVTINYQY